MRAWLLAAAVLVGGAGTALLVVDRPREVLNTRARPAIEAIAQDLARALDTAARTSRERAFALATDAEVRAALAAPTLPAETGAAPTLPAEARAASTLPAEARAVPTLSAMISQRFTPAPAETLEVFARGASVLQLPPGTASRPLTGTRAIIDATARGELLVAVAAPIGQAGGIVISREVDVSTIRAALAPHVHSAALAGTQAPLSLIAGTPSSSALEVPVPITELGTPVVIAATIAPPSVTPPRFSLLRYVLWASALLLAISALLLRARAATAPRAT